MISAWVSFGEVIEEEVEEKVVVEEVEEVEEVEVR